MDKSKIIAALEAAGIEHDKRQSAEKLAALLPEDGNVTAIVIRDFWPTDDENDRVRAGEIIRVSKDDLITGLERGTLARFTG